jgi:hypothetical protein
MRPTSGLFLEARQGKRILPATDQNLVEELLYSPDFFLSSIISRRNARLIRV